MFAGAHNQGVKVLVEVTDKKKVIVLFQFHEFSSAVLELRSLVIQKVRDAVFEFCPKVDTRELFVRPCDVTYPLTTDTTFTFSIKSLAVSIVNQHHYVISTSNTVTWPVHNLLPVEVYANLGTNILHAFFNTNDSAYRQVVSDQFLSSLTFIWSENPKLVDIIFSAISPSIPQTSVISLEPALKSWRDGSDGTYKSLRQILDQLSVFAGMNPLVSTCGHQVIFLCC